MGACASIHDSKSRAFESEEVIRREGAAGGAAQAVVKVIQQDGRVAELKAPVSAAEALTAMAGEEGAGFYYLCSWESMFVDACAPHVPEGERLSGGQVYFVMLRSKLRQPLSLEEMCELAVKASSCLSLHDFRLSCSPMRLR